MILQQDIAIYQLNGISKAIGGEGLTVAGAVYDIVSGAVELL